MVKNIVFLVITIFSSYGGNPVAQKDIHARMYLFCVEGTIGSIFEQHSFQEESFFASSLVFHNPVEKWLSKVTFYPVIRLRIFLPIFFSKNGTIHRKIGYFGSFHFFAQNDFENEFSYFSSLIHPDWKLFTIIQNSILTWNCNLLEFFGEKWHYP